jgi:hypothetical protein
MNKGYRSIGRRAKRSLRWYPTTWRRRFGDEFVALMEDDLAEQPRSPARTFNVMRAGLSARLADLGVVGRTVDPTRQTQVGFATTFLIGLWFIAAASGIWAISMLGWNGGDPGHRTIWAVTCTTAFMTASLGALCFVLGLAVLALLASAAVQIARGAGRQLLVPTFGIMTGIGWLLTAQHVILRYVIARGGIQWSDPGEAIKQIAGATSVFVSQVENAVIRPSALGSDELVAVTVPVAILLLGISALTIVRRVQWPPSLLRWTGAVMVGSLALMLTFVVSFLLWMLVGGYGIGFGISANFQFIELGVAGLLAVCCGTCVVRSRPQPTSVIEA